MELAPETTPANNTAADPHFFNPGEKVKVTKTWPQRCGSYLGEYSFPPKVWLPQYNLHKFRCDAIAGCVVGSMLIPQGLAYSQLAGLPPIYGLYANIGSAIGYSLFGTSKQVIYGPVALPAILTKIAIDSAGIPSGTRAYENFAFCLCFVNGFILFVMGLLRVGALSNFLSATVRSAFITAAGVIIFLSQLKTFFGITGSAVDCMGEWYCSSLIKEGSILMQLDTMNFPTFALGFLSMVILLIKKQYKNKIPKWIPVALILMSITMLLSFLIDFEKYKMKIVGDIAKGMPALKNPLDFKNIAPDGKGGEYIGKVFQSALEIAVISYISAWSLAVKFAKDHGYTVSSNQELVAQGIGNMLSSPFQSQPVTASFSRSAVNDEMGAETPMANIIVLVLVIFTLMLLTPVFYFLPKCVLAAIVMVSVKGLIDVAEVKYLWRVDKVEFGLWWATFLMTIGLGISKGIMYGIVLSVMLSVYNSSSIYMTMVAPLATPTRRESSTFVDVSMYPTEKHEVPKLSIARFDGPIYFANSVRFGEMIRSVAEGKDPERQAEPTDVSIEMKENANKSVAVVPSDKEDSKNAGNQVKHVKLEEDQIVDSSLTIIVLDFSAVVSIDCTALHTLKDIIVEFSNEKAHVKLVFAGILPAVYDAMDRAGIKEILKNDQFFFSVNDACDYYQKDGDENSVTADNMRSPDG